VDKEKQKLLNVIENFAQKRIIVWGDFILDEYIYGDTRRISREAPVLILSYHSKELSLGGAGNSVLNLLSLGAQPIPVGVIGADDSGKKIRKILRQKGISTEYLLLEKKYQTPLKTRILAGEGHTRKQQILRIDREIFKSSHALLISDYNYFTVKEEIFSQILPWFKKVNIPVTLDTRFRLLNFKGVTVATPNEPEVEEALRIKIDEDTSLLKVSGKQILKIIQSPALLITRGSKGMILFEAHKIPLAIPIHGPTDIVDVTGAGDTVISVFTLAIACGATFRQAALLANYAGSVVVMKKGTAALSLSELKKAIIS